MLVVLVALGCSGPPNQQTASRLACERYLSLVSNSDVENMAEVREKISEISSLGNLAAPTVKDASKNMLIAITVGDFDDLGTTANEMGAACVELGYQ